jgi:hypothetical protein
MNKIILLIIFIIINLITNVIGYLMPDLNISSFIIYQIWINVLLFLLAILT